MNDWRGLMIRLETLAMLALIRVGLWIIPFSWWRSRLARALTPQGDQSSEDELVVVAASDAVRWGGRLVPGASCLVQALALRWLLSRRRIGCELRLGVGRSRRGDFEAHAWIEHNGRLVIGEEPAPRFQPLANDRLR